MIDGPVLAVVTSKSGVYSPDIKAARPEDEAIPAPGKKVTPGNAPGSQVSQHAYRLLDSRSTEKTLATGGLGPCIAVALWDPQSKTAVMAHFDIHTDVRRSLAAILRDFKRTGGKTSGLQAHLVGGWSGFSEGLRNDLRRQLSRDKIGVREDTKLGEYGRVCECSLNAATGEFKYAEETRRQLGTKESALRNERSITATSVKTPLDPT